jgi:hypothetical protein
MKSELLMDFHIDLLLRIDFNAIFEPDNRLDDDSNEYQTLLNYYKDKYNFPNYYGTGDHKYIRLSDIKELRNYIDYLLDIGIDDEDLCCPIGQSIGIFHNHNLLVNCDTDTGTCHFFDGHYATLHTIIVRGQTPEEIINYFGKVINDESIYMVNSREELITIDSQHYLFSKNEFKQELERLINKVSEFYHYVNHYLLLSPTTNISRSLINQAFPLDLKERLDTYLKTLGLR